jgi:hypothetical protein
LLGEIKRLEVKSKSKVYRRRLNLDVGVKQWIDLDISALQTLPQISIGENHRHIRRGDPSLWAWRGSAAPF